MLTRGPFLPAASQVWHTSSIVVLRGTHTVNINVWNLWGYNSNSFFFFFFQIKWIESTELLEFSLSCLGEIFNIGGHDIFACEIFSTEEKLYTLGSNLSWKVKIVDFCAFYLAVWPRISFSELRFIGAHSTARYESYEGRLSGLRSAQELQYHFASRDLRCIGFVCRPRRIVDYSIVPLFLFDIAFYADRTRARCRYVCPASINPAVHFPPASNRILDGRFLDGVRFRAHRANRYFYKQPLATFYRVVAARFSCSFLRSFIMFTLPTANRLFRWAQKKKMSTLSIFLVSQLP